MVPDVETCFELKEAGFSQITLLGYYSWEICTYEEQDIKWDIDFSSSTTHKIEVAAPTLEEIIYELLTEGYFDFDNNFYDTILDSSENMAEVAAQIYIEYKS